MLLMPMDPYHRWSGGHSNRPDSRGVRLLYWKSLFRQTA